MAPLITIRAARPKEAEALLELLEALAGSHFYPHPFDRENAERIASYRGQDVYLVAWEDSRPVAYGLLRGWDAGYAIPSLGVAVRPDCEGRGYGKAMLIALHQAARAKGATAVRLRVHPDNVRARRLYDLFGYRAAGEERGETVMFLKL